MFASEWIHPLSEHARNILISEYCPEHQQEDAKENPANRICLAHIKLGLAPRKVNNPLPDRDMGLAELGKEDSDQAAEDGPFTLRDFSLDSDQMTDLGLPVLTYAEYMGVALARLHRELQLDGAGVRFVLGGPREADPEGSRAWQLLQFGSHRVWMTHFHRCRHATANLEGLKKWKEAYLSNEGYFPRRGRDKVLWNVFQQAYLDETGRIADSRGLTEAEMQFWRDSTKYFISAVRRQGWRSG